MVEILLVTWFFMLYEYSVLLLLFLFCVSRKVFSKSNGIALTMELLCEICQD